jgi:hypothetical protein
VRQIVRSNARYNVKVFTRPDFAPFPALKPVKGASHVPTNSYWALMPWDKKVDPTSSNAAADAGNDVAVAVVEHQNASSTVKTDPDTANNPPANMPSTERGTKNVFLEFLDPRDVEYKPWVKNGPFTIPDFELNFSSMEATYLPIAVRSDATNRNWVASPAMHKLNPEHFKRWAESQDEDIRAGRIPPREPVKKTVPTPTPTQTTMGQQQQQQQQQQPGFSTTSSIPPELRGVTTSSMSVQEALSQENVALWQAGPANKHEYVPRNDAQIEDIAILIHNAMVDFDGFCDKAATQNKVNKLIAQKYEDSELRRKCMVIAHDIVRLHVEGATGLGYAMDPTQEVRPGTKGTRRNGGLVYHAKKTAEEDRRLSLSERVFEVCKTVRYSKAAATDLLDGSKGLAILWAPRTALKIKIENIVGNNKKKDLLVAGKVTLQLQEEQRSLSSVQPKRPRDGDDDGGDGDGDEEEESSKRMRTQDGLHSFEYDDGSAHYHQGSFGHC